MRVQRPPAKKSTTANQRNKHNDEKYIQWVTTLSLTIRVVICLAIFCCLPNLRILRNSPQIWTYSSSRSSKVIDLGTNRKRICNFLLLINSNFVRISYRFPDIDALHLKIVCISHPTLVWRPLAEERILYTAEKYIEWAEIPSLTIVAIFIRLTVVGCWPHIYEISRNSEIIRAYNSSRSSKVIDLGVNRKRICDFLLFIRP